MVSFTFPSWNPFKWGSSPKASPSITPSPRTASPTHSEEGDPTHIVLNNSNNKRKNNLMNAAYGENSNANARLRPMYNKFRNNLAEKTSKTRNNINLTFNGYKNLRNTRGLKKFWNNSVAKTGDEVYGNPENVELKPLYNSFRKSIANTTGQDLNTVDLSFPKYKELKAAGGLNAFWRNATGDNDNAATVLNGNGETTLVADGDNQEPRGGRRRTYKRSTKRRRNAKRSSSRR